MAKGIDGFIGSLEKGGMRPNLFEVTLNSPFGDEDNLTFKCKATGIPSSQIGTIELPYMGHPFKLAGNRTYNEWNISIIAEEGLAVRRTFENWMDNILDGESNATTTIRPKDYMVDGTITTFSKTGDEDTQYEIRGVWPSTIAEIALAWDSNDTIGEFDVTLQVQYFKRIK